MDYLLQYAQRFWRNT